MPLFLPPTLSSVSPEVLASPCARVDRPLLRFGRDDGKQSSGTLPGSVWLWSQMDLPRLTWPVSWPTRHGLLQPLSGLLAAKDLLAPCIGPQGGSPRTHGRAVELVPRIIINDVNLSWAFTDPHPTVPFPYLNHGS